ncbi:MAG: hypothetical protein K0S47_2945 [Herbinix sp.]|jgi:hypothetical protein|nr:hypothetical protein [Herbinix sp.]
MHIHLSPFFGVYKPQKAVVFWNFMVTVLYIKSFVKNVTEIIFVNIPKGESFTNQD